MMPVLPTSARRALQVLLGLAAGLAALSALGQPPAPTPPASPAAISTTALEALQRLRGVDLEANPALQSAVLRILESTRGTAAFVEIVRDFRLTGQEEGLVEVASVSRDAAAAAEALRLVLAAGQAEKIRAALAEGEAARRSALIEALALGAERAAIPLLSDATRDSAIPGAARSAAVRGLARTEEGAQELLRLGGAGALDEAARTSAGLALAQARWPEVREASARVFPLPRTAEGAELPPLSTLVTLPGDAARGARVFRGERAGCIQCHRVGPEGVDFGPALGQIGTKLGKQALFEAILDPSAGVSFGFEGWDFVLKNGDEPSGILVSETAEELAVKQPTGVVLRVPKSDLASRTRQKLSIMPAGLGQILTRGELVDLVEYLTTLKAPPGDSGR